MVLVATTTLTEVITEEVTEREVREGIAETVGTTETTEETTEEEEEEEEQVEGMVWPRLRSVQRPTAETVERTAEPPHLRTPEKVVTEAVEGSLALLVPPALPVIIESTATMTESPERVEGTEAGVGTSEATEITTEEGTEAVLTGDMAVWTEAEEEAVWEKSPQAAFQAEMSEAVREEVTTLATGTDEGTLGRPRVPLLSSMPVVLLALLLSSSRGLISRLCLLSRDSSNKCLLSSSRDHLSTRSLPPEVSGIVMPVALETTLLFLLLPEGWL